MAIKFKFLLEDYKNIHILPPTNYPDLSKSAFLILETRYTSKFIKVPQKSRKYFLKRQMTSPSCIYPVNSFLRMGIWDY